MEKQRDNHIEQNVTEQHTTEQGGIYRKIRDFALDETGVGVIELVLILVEIYTYKRYVYLVFNIPQISISLIINTIDDYNCIYSNR